MNREEKFKLLKVENTESMKLTKETESLLQKLHKTENETKNQLQEIEGLLHVVAKQLEILDQIDANIRYTISRYRNNA